MRIELPSGTPAEIVESREARRAVVIAPDVMGLRPLFDDMCRRLSEEHSWTVCAVEPFPGREEYSLEQRRSEPLDDKRLLGDLTDAADRTGSDRVAVIGFCLGGMNVLKAAGTGRFDRGVAFYGMIRTPSHWRGSNTVEPLDALRSPGASPVLAVVGERDSYTPPDDVAELEALPNVAVVRYRDAEHGFVHDPSRPAHRAADAADAWRRAVDFLG